MENEIICGDCLELISKLEDESIDLVVTSPPYNIDLGNNKYKKDPYDLYSDNKEHKSYISWLTNIFNKLYYKMKSGGRVCINIGDGKNGAVPTHSDIIQFMTKSFYLPMGTIIWNKNQVSNRTAWGSFLSPSCPSFPTPFEYILIFGCEDKKLRSKGETDLTKDEFVKWSYGIWDIKPETKMKKWGHPAMFPLEIPQRLIKMLSWKDALVLDPFCGTGTTCVSAQKLGRRYIGFDISPDYCEIARNRLNDCS